MKAKRTSKASHPAGFRYDKRDWLHTVEGMLARGATYGEIAKVLGVGHSTVCRYCWQRGLASVSVHRNTTRAAILKTAKITPEVMHYQSIQVTKHQDDIRRGLRPKEGGRK